MRIHRILFFFMKTILFVTSVLAIASANAETQTHIQIAGSMAITANQASPSPASAPTPAAAVSTTTSVISSSNASSSPSLPSVTNVIPAPPDFAVKGYILLDANSNFVIAEKNADVRMPPASITKIMSLYIAANALKTGQIQLDSPVTISENAWRVGGSKMFVKVGTQIPVRDLIDGIVIASGNDATVAMAEYLAGSEQAFVSLMNQMTVQLGMHNTHYADSNGLPAESHYSTPRDIAILARTWISVFPEYYTWFKQKWVIHNGIKQSNRNRLLWRDTSVDGMKTGHTDDAGYCLVASAVRHGMRLIAVVMGAANDNARTNYSEALLDYGFRFYATHKLYAADVVLKKARVWFGKKREVTLGLKNDLYITLPSGQYQKLKASITTNKLIQAPLKKGDVVGNVTVTLSGKSIATQPLIALQDIPRAGIIASLGDRIMLLFYTH